MKNPKTFNSHSAPKAFSGKWHSFFARHRGNDNSQFVRN
jgi:hypothetical protein